jgi:microsomal dipeptidase-like Zn-dependent dipeptidase
MCKEVFGYPGMSPRQVTDMIRTIGPSRCTLSTDYGWTTAVPHPAASMHEFLEALWGEGLTEDEVQAMVSTNPARLFDPAF